MLYRMNILILTSKKHIYANYVLKALFGSGMFDGHKVAIFEQKSIIPGKSFLLGLLVYLRRAGFWYVLNQFAKQKFFSNASKKALQRKDVENIYYPFLACKYCTVSLQKGDSVTTMKTRGRIRACNPDLILSVFSKEIIPQDIISLPRYGCINVHPSMLPTYRGVSPTFWALANQEKTHGCTLHYIDATIDTGAIIAQETVPIHEIKSEHELYMHCSVATVRLIKNMFDNLNNGQLGEVAQGSKEKGTYNSLPTKKAVRQFYRSGFSFFKIHEFLDPQWQEQFRKF